jgi:hypothetical protein
MSKKRAVRIRFPLGGIDREGPHHQQPPYTTIDCLNVRPIGQFEHRERGGSRPGIIRAYAEDLGDEVRLLAPMNLALGDGFTNFSDTFSGTSIAANWSLPTDPWDTDYTNLPSILTGGGASVDYTVATGAAVADLLTTIDTSSAYTVEMYCSPWGGAWHGKYTLYLRMDDTSPDITDEGVKITLTMTGTDGSYAATMKSYTGGAAGTLDESDSGTLSTTKAGWLSATVDGTTISVYWGETQIMTGTAEAMTGTRAGFALDCTVAAGVTNIHVFRVQYFSTNPNQGVRSMMVASASGSLFKEATYSHLTEISSTLTFRTDTILTAAQSGQVLVISDWGDLSYTGTDAAVAGTALTATGAPDWTALTTPPDPEDMVAVITNPQGSAVAGTYKISTVVGATVTLASSAGTGACSVRIERAPKVYDPSDDSIAIVTATAGQTPTGCPLCTRYLDRVVLAGAEIAPHVWYMSRAGGYLDWDYSQSDSRRAVAGGVGDSGVPGQAITALVSHSDDFILFGCRSQLWRMRGDPAFGGSLDAVSYTVGIIGPKAWCIGPAGELIFVALDGVYMLAPGGASYPQSISERSVPAEFRNIDPNQYDVALEFDVVDNGVNIFLTPKNANSATHWWIDWKNKTFWPIAVATGLDPTATCVSNSIAIEEAGVVMGCRDGRVRRFSPLTDLDDGVAFSSYVIIGPLLLAMEGYLGSVMSIEASIAETSGDVTWTTYPALTAEATQTATASDTGTFVAGANDTIRPSVRGQAYTLKLAGASGRKWAVEGITSIIARLGRRRSV